MTDDVGSIEKEGLLLLASTKPSVSNVTRRLREQ